MHKTREIRRKEAFARQLLCDKRTREQQIAKLDAGGYVATRERARLQ